MLIDINKLSEELCISKSFIYQAVGRREIPHLKIGRSVRFDLDEINQWLRKMKVEPK